MPQGSLWIFSMLNKCRSSIMLITSSLILQLEEISPRSLGPFPHTCKNKQLYKKDLCWENNTHSMSSWFLLIVPNSNVWKWFQYLPQCKVCGVRTTWRNFLSQVNKKVDHTKLIVATDATDLTHHNTVIPLKAIRSAMPSNLLVLVWVKPTQMPSLSE